MLKEFVKTLGKKFVPLYVEAWERDVSIKVWSGADRAHLTSWYQRHKDNPDRLAEFNARIVIASLVNEDGQPEFTEKDLALVQSIDAKTLDLIASECLKLNGIGQDETIAKN